MRLGVGNRNDVTLTRVGPGWCDIAPVGSGHGSFQPNGRAICPGTTDRTGTAIPTGTIEPGG
jgi:hypothetical protein